MKQNLGQFFSYNKELKEQVYNLCKNKGRVLEPSAGIGSLCSFFKEQGTETNIAIEKDSSLKFEYDNIQIMDFFDYDINEKFDTIYGNPPYVKQQNIIDKHKIKSTQTSLNLFLYFIEKSFYHLNDNGEIIFIIPREFFTNTRAKNIRKLLFDNGTITDVIDYQERKMFNDAAPYIVIIRYEKDNFSHLTNYTINSKSLNKKEFFQDGFIKFSNEYGKRLGDFFDVKVGMVSGKNNIFKHNELGNIRIICSDYYNTKEKQKYIFYQNIKNVPSKTLDYLLKNKKKLIERKIRNFDESNWFCWGAVRNLQYMLKEGECLYVNSKTRKENPFYKDKISFFDGSVLGLFPKSDDVDLNMWLKNLNNEELLREQGFLVGNKFVFTQNTLSNLRT